MSRDIKARRGEHILEIAFDLFVMEGIVAVEMIHVAAAAEVSRATLYRYFPSKYALAFAVMQHVARRDFITKFIAERRTFVGTGREKFALFIDQLVRAYRTNIDFFRYTAMFAAFYDSQMPAKEQAIMYRELYAGLFVENTPETFLLEGQRDGSVREDLDTGLYLSMVLAALPGVAEHIAINPELAKLTYELDDPTRLLDSLAEALVRGLMPHDT